MASGSAIEWTDATWNPVTGCTRVSPGCANCYALELAPRLREMSKARVAKALAEGKPAPDPKWLNVRDGGAGSGPAFGVTLHPDELALPLRWRKPRLVFVNSMSDLFHEEVPDEFIRRVFATMYEARRHTFQVLTKRPERMRDLLAGWYSYPGQSPNHPLPNVWLGVSIENRQFVGRADVLRETPAAVRFISAEPLLGPLIPCMCAGGMAPGVLTDGRCACGADWVQGDGWRGLDLTGIDWLIVGGESGPRARTMDPQWVRDLRDACLGCCPLHPLGLCTGEAECDNRPAFFFKQWGGRTPKAGGRELDGRTWDEFPARAV